MWKQTLGRVHTAAEIYNNEDGWAPSQAIARELKVSVRTANRLVARGRELGLITREAPTGAPPKNPLIHGTVHGYESHGCRCEPCTSARSANQAEHRRRRVERREVAEFAHGETGYTNWGCRCELCCIGHRDRCSAYYQKRRETAS